MKREIPCPKCGKEVKAATKQEVKRLIPLLREWHITNSESPNLIICLNCGWFDTLGAMIGAPYERVLKLLKG